MTKRDRRVALAIAISLMTWQCARAAEPLRYKLPDETAKLRDGLGVETARNICATCHSVDYVAIQPPKQGPAFWQAEVAKMRNVYKASISDADAKTIADYLAQTY